MSRPRAWVIVVRKATESTPKLLAAGGKLITQRGRALNFTEFAARKLAAVLERTHASYFFKVKPWGRPL